CAREKLLPGYFDVW
nr:immunoglobulin heavy chain junction region [Mus musculus]